LQSLGGADSQVAEFFGGRMKQFGFWALARL
jgi:hypothetical protein